MKKRIDLKSIILLVSSIVTYVYLYPNIDIAAKQGISPSTNLNSFLVVLILTFVVLTILPLLDKGGAISERIKGYNNIVFAVMLVLSAMFLLQAFSATGRVGNDVKVLGTVIAVSFTIVANFLPRVKMNAIAGIRTPWSMKSEYVWKKTHSICGILGLVIGIALVIGNIFVGSHQVYMVTLYSIGVWLLVAVVISFVVWKQGQN